MPSSSSSLFFNDTATTEIYTLSLHDALPICVVKARPKISPHSIGSSRVNPVAPQARATSAKSDRKSTRLNSSHITSSYAVFCLKKKTRTGSVTEEQGASYQAAADRPPIAAHG